MPYTHRALAPDKFVECAATWNLAILGLNMKTPEIVAMLGDMERAEVDFRTLWKDGFDAEPLSDDAAERQRIARIRAYNGAAEALRTALCAVKHALNNDS